MAKITNSPKDVLSFDLERRKSFTFQVQLKYESGAPVDLTGSTMKFIMKEPYTDEDPFDLMNLLVNSQGTIVDPLNGKVQFSFQAAELDSPAGEYDYAIVLTSQDGYSNVLTKGQISLLENVEADSMHRQYSTFNPLSEIELSLRGNTVVSIVANIFEYANIGRSP